MTTFLWIFPSAIAVSILAIVVRRLLLHTLTLPHGLVLVLSVLGPTAALIAGALQFLPSELGSAVASAVLISGLGVGIFLTAQEFRRPYNG